MEGPSPVRKSSPSQQTVAAATSINSSDQHSSQPSSTPKPIYDSNARAAHAFLTSKRKDTTLVPGFGAGIGNLSSFFSAGGTRNRHSISPADHGKSIKQGAGVLFSYHRNTMPSNVASHEQDDFSSRSLSNVEASIQQYHIISQSQKSPGGPSLSSPELAYGNVSYQSPVCPSASLTGQSKEQGTFLNTDILTTDPIDDQQYFEDQLYHPHPDKTQGLDLETVISHFQAVHKKNTSHSHSGLFKNRQSTVYPRFTFYSEKTGVIRSNSWESFDISTFDDVDDLTSSQVTCGIRDILTTSPFWIDIAAPTHQEMSLIAKVFNLHPLTTEDIQTPDTREKCEVFQRYYFVVIRSFEQDQFKPNFLQPITVYLVIFDECILSFQSAANPHSRNVRSRIDQLSSYGDVSISTEFINYALIDDIVDSFIPLLKVIELEVDSIEELVLIPVTKNDYVDMDMLRRIGMVRKRVMQSFRLISTKADVIKTIITRYMNQMESAETKFYLEDIHDHVLTMMQNLSHYEKSLARSHSNYLAQISIDITQASNRTSDTVMRMTLLASILVPLNVITGLFGMNVRVPGETGQDLSWFFGILVFMVVLTMSTYYLAKRHRLI